MWKFREVGAEEGEGIDPEGTGEGDELDHVENALAALDLAVDGRVETQTAGDLALGEVRRFAGILDGQEKSANLETPGRFPIFLAQR